MRRVFDTMGTVASVEASGLDERTGLAVEHAMAAWDATFSLYRPDSELSRIAAGTLTLADSSERVRDTYALALSWSGRTDGAFTPHRPDGVLDLDGVVKALAIAEAGEILAAAGCHGVTINVGGDILISPRPTDGPVIAGIVDPADRTRLLTSVRLRGDRRAMATSGSAERGDHIWLGGSRAPAEFVQATVIADDIVTADVLATAIIAGGRAMLDEVTARFDVDVLTVDRGGDLLATPGLRAALAS